MALERLQVESLGSLMPAPGGEYTGQCPLCGAKPGHFYVNPEKGVYYCHKCGGSGRLADGLPRFPRPVLASPPEPTAPVARRDAAYNALLKALTLSAEHFRHLVDVRKMGREQIARNGYRTLPPGQRVRLAEKASSEVDLLGVPGFYRIDGSWSLAGPPGLLVPVRDFEGRIVGCQVRTFDPALPKYVWLSSNGKESGAKAETHFHVAYGSKDARVVWLTEGPLKADVAAPLLGRVVVAVPGVNTLRRSLALELRARGCNTAVLAFDSDARTKPQVMSALRRALLVLRGAGLAVQVAAWPPAFKGIDDLLLASRRPRLHTPGGRSLNRVLISGSVVNFRVDEIQQKKPEGVRKSRKLTVILEDKGAPKGLPVLLFGDLVDKALSEGLDKGDWLEGEGHLKLWTDTMGNTHPHVVLTTVRVLRAIQEAWWEEVAQS